MYSSLSLHVVPYFSVLAASSQELRSAVLVYIRILPQLRLAATTQIWVCRLWYCCFACNIYLCFFFVNFRDVDFFLVVVINCINGCILDREGKGKAWWIKIKCFSHTALFDVTGVDTRRRWIQGTVRFSPTYKRPAHVSQRARFAGRQWQWTTNTFLLQVGV